MDEKKYIPPLGPAVPRWGNRLTKAVGRLLLAGYGWRVEGQLPDASKFVIVLAPHTSCWDFLTNMGTMLAVGFKSHWFIADAYDWWPFGKFLRWLGAVPVNRSMSHDLVSKMVQRIKESDEFILAIYPEGARKRVGQWKTGFWHIASRSGVPIQLVTVDYEKRVTLFGPVIESSGSVEADMEKIQAHYQGARGKHPDQFDGDYL